MGLELVLIMVILLFTAFSAFCFYKLYQLYFKRNELVGGNLPAHMEAQRTEPSWLRVHPVLQSLLPDMCRVGETVCIKIKFPGLLKRDLPGLQNQVTSYLSVKICEQRVALGLSTCLSDTLPVLLDYETPLPGDKDLTILVKFTVKLAGVYTCDIKYLNKTVTGSPLVKRFHPGRIDPSCTVFLHKAPALSCVTDVPSYCTIEPKDSYNNVCQIEEIDMSKFRLRVTEIEASKKGQLVEPIMYNFCQDMNDWGNLQPAVRASLELFHPGIFLGTVYYDDTVISNGTFDIVCLTPEENERFRAILADNPSAKYHEALLVNIGLGTTNSPQKSSKQKKVFIYVAPNLLSVKEFFVGIIPNLVVSYRVIPATRIQYIRTVPGTSLCEITIWDRVQNKVVLHIEVSTARIVVALFLFFLQQRLGGSETFENKLKFFHEELKKVMPEKSRASPVAVSVIRSNIVESTFSETKALNGRDWCRKFKIKFVGEEGADDGGLRREWLDLLCRQMFDNSPNGMFCSMGNSRLVLPNPNRNTEFYTLKHYELAGHVVGKCMFETAIGGHFKQMVNARFGRSFLAQIIGFPPHYKFFEQDDPELFETKIKYILESSDVENMDLTFSEEVYAGGKLSQTVELIPNGANVKVTEENKLEYLQALAQHRLCNQVLKEIKAFTKGINDIVPFGLLTNFDENELELLMCGQSLVTVEDLKNFHVVTPSNDLHVTKVISWFWSAVLNMTDSERARLLQFTTGSSLLPHGGFQNLEPRFRITIYETHGKLPIAHTCFNEICLSNHNTFEEFQQSLRTAILEGNEGFSFN